MLVGPRQFALILSAWLAGLCLAGCGGNPARSARTPPAPDDGGLRIVSFSPALSRTVVDLGLGDRIVGRSRFCTFLDPSVPVVGDLQHVNFERLIDLGPTHVLVQPPGGGVGPDLQRLAREKGWHLVSFPHLNGIDDVREMVSALSSILDSAETPGAGKLPETASRLLERLDEALRPAGADGAWTGSTLIVYGTTPVSVFGRGTYLDDVLSRLGAVNAAPMIGWGELTLEDVTRLDPQAIVLVRPGARSGGERPVDAMEAAGVLASVDVEAVRAGRIGVLGHPDALLPSTAVAEVADELRQLLASWGAGQS